jgi:regulator of protease activity HflC (stomatin/prohibitin superfamily)
VISRDNISVKVSAVIYFRVVDAERAIINVEDFFEATAQLAQTTLRSILGQHELDEMLSQRDKLNEGIQKLLDEQTESWGIKVNAPSPSRQRQSAKDVRKLYTQRVSSKHLHAC